MTRAADSDLRVLIVDDEAASRLAFVRRLEAVAPTVEICAEARNGEEALRHIAELSPDAVFLDIQMPGMSGLDVARALPRDASPIVVFLTAFSDHAVDAFATSALDYLTKPVAADRLRAAIRRVREEREKRRQLTLARAICAAVDRHAAPEPTERRLALTTDRGVVRVAEDDIRAIETAGAFTCVHSGGETHVVTKPLKQFEAELAPGRFLRVHRRTLINVDAVERLDAPSGRGATVRLIGGDIFAVSRRRVAALRAALAER